MIPYTMLTDDELVRLASLGDKSAFDELYARSYRTVSDLIDRRNQELLEAQEEIGRKYRI